MGNVNLLPIENKGNRNSEEYLRYIAESLATLQDELQNILEGRISAENIKANTITANKMSVTELSAISADLGTITAGSITTSAQINVGTDATIGNNLNMGESDYTGSKKITFSSDTGISAELEALSGDVALRADGFVTMTIGSSQGLVVNKKITAPAIHASNGITGTWYAASSSGGTPDIALSFVDGILVSAV